MPKKKKNYPDELPLPDRNPEIKPNEDPETPVIPEEDPDFIPDDDPFETPPYEIPKPGEAP